MLNNLEIRRRAATHGFVLEESPSDGMTVFAWHHGTRSVGPRFLLERQAVGWMSDELDRAEANEITKAPDVVGEHAGGRA